MNRWQINLAGPVLRGVCSRGEGRDRDRNRQQTKAVQGVTRGGYRSGRCSRAHSAAEVLSPTPMRRNTLPR